MADSGVQQGRVLIFTTGGTIASTHDAVAGGLMSNIDGVDLVGSVPNLSGICKVEVIELANSSSTFFTPVQVFGWTQVLHEAMSDIEVVGAVVTHGTDTLEESAYLCDLALNEEKPLVFTGAMRTSSEVLTDGPRNILSSVRVAAHPHSRGLGVLVVMNDEIHAAKDVTKTHAEALDTFTSPGLGALGAVSRGRDGDEVLFFRRLFEREHIATDRIEDRVAYVKAVLGSDSSMIDAAIDQGVAGIVIEAFAGGEVTPFMAPGIERGREQGIEMVVSTRAVRGRPLDLYADLGEGKWLKDHGVHFAGTINGPKARVKLMLALGVHPRANIAGYF